MMREASNFGASDVIGVAIAHHSHGRHLGVFYVTADGAFLMHQAFDCQFEREELSQKYVWVPLGWPPERLQQVSNLCAVLWRRYGENREEKLRYAFAYRDGHFSPGGAFVAKGGIGLTCATFVMALFASVGLQLVDTTGWPSDRPEDAAILKRLVSAIRVRDPQHADAVASEQGCARYRPEEVFAAAAHRPHPASFADVSSSSLAVLALIAKKLPLL